MLQDIADIELKFIKATLNSKQAFRTAQGTINGYSFSHPYLSWLWTEMCHYAERTGHKPGPELIDLLMPKLDAGLAAKAESYQEALQDVEYNVDDLEFYIDTLVKRLRLQAQLEAITNAQESIQEGDPDSVAQYLATAAISAPGLKPKTKAGLSFETPEVQWIPTGFSALDFHIGGLGRGELGVIMGVSGVGKSIVATNIVQGALKARWQARNSKYIVWHIDTENGEHLVKTRHIARFTQVSARALERNQLSTSQEERVQSWLKRNEPWLNDQLFIYPAEYLGTTLEDLERELTHLQASGHMPDLIVFDSPDHLLPPNTRKGAQHWEIFAEIYTRMRAMAKRYNVALWAITQALFQFEGKIATQAAVADSKQKTRLANITLSLNTEKDDSQKRFLYVAKNRTGSCRFKIALEIDWDHMLIRTLGESVEPEKPEDAEA